MASRPKYSCAVDAKSIESQNECSLTLSTPTALQVVARGGAGTGLIRPSTGENPSLTYPEGVVRNSAKSDAHAGRRTDKSVRSLEALHRATVRAFRGRSAGVPLTFFRCPMQIEFQPKRKSLLISLMSSVFLVTACGGGGEGESSSSDTATPAPAAATAPAPAPAPAPAGTAALTWTAPTGAVTGYRVYFGTTSRSYSQAFGSGNYVTTTSSTLSGLPSGYTYYFSVTAIDATGVESAYSNEASKLIP